MYCILITCAKCEYLTGEDLVLKPSTVKQAKFAYPPLLQVLTDGLDKNDKKKNV